MTYDYCNSMRAGMDQLDVNRSDSDICRGYVIVSYFISCSSFLSFQSLWICDLLLQVQESNSSPVNKLQLKEKGRASREIFMISTDSGKLFFDFHWSFFLFVCKPNTIRFIAFLGRTSSMTLRKSNLCFRIVCCLFCTNAWSELRLMT